MSKKSTKGAIFIPIAKIYFMMMGYIMQMLIGRFLTKGELGLFHYTNSIISPINMVLIQGGVQSTSHFVSKGDNLKGVNWFGIKIFFTLSLTIFITLQIFAPQISLTITHSANNAIYFRVGAFISLFYGVYAVLIGRINGEKKFTQQALFDIVFSSIKVGSIAIILILGGKLLNMIAGWFFATFLITFLAFIYVKPKITPYNGGKQYIKFMLPVVLYQGFFYILLNIDTWMLGILSDGKDVLNNGGNYLSVTVLSKIPFQIVLSITFIIFPIISKLSSIEDSKISKEITKIFRYATLFASPFVILIFVNPSFFLQFIYGKGYIGNQFYLKILVAGVLFLSLFVISNTIISGSGKPVISFVITVITISILIILGVILIPKYSLKGAAISASISYFIGFLISFGYIFKKYQFKIPFKTFLRVLIVWGICFTLFHFIKFDNIYLQFLQLAVMGLLIYPIFYILKEFSKEDIDLMLNSLPINIKRGKK